MLAALFHRLWLMTAASPCLLPWSLLVMCYSCGRRLTVHY